jgi:uncharacterized repeat protein (TIGR01451 family)
MIKIFPVLLLTSMLTGCASLEKPVDSETYELSRNGVSFSWSSPIPRTYEGCSKFFFKVTNRGSSDLMNVTVDLLPTGLSLILSNIAIGQTRVKKFDCVTNVDPEGSTIIVFYNSKANLQGEVFEEFISTEEPSE